MSAFDLVLRPLRVDDEASFMDAVSEFRRVEPAWNFALNYDESAGFTEYVRRLDCWSRNEEVPAGLVPAHFLVGVVDDRVVGRLSLRHVLNDYLARFGGHIGYGVRPSARGRGYATEMLRQSLALCPPLGIERALLTCGVNNVASRRTIERCGGVFEGEVFDPAQGIPLRRYWITTDSTTA